MIFFLNSFVILNLSSLTSGNPIRPPCTNYYVCAGTLAILGVQFGPAKKVKKRKELSSLKVSSKSESVVVYYKFTEIIHKQAFISYLIYYVFMI